MKKVLLIVFVLLLVLVGGAAAFIATFDLNRYRPLIAQKASEALGAPVNLGRISLAWKNGLALRIQDLTVYSDAEKKTASAKLKEASAAVKLAPLLNKEIRVTSIVLIEPQAILVKGADGKIGLKGANPQATPAQPSTGSKNSPGMPAPSFSINLFQVRGGAVRFQDLAAQPPLDLTVRNVDVDVKNFSLTKPFSFRARAGLFSSKQNLQVEGVVTLPQGTKGGSIDKAVFKTDLSDLNLAEMGRSFPSTASLGIEELKGVLETKVAHLDLGASGAANADLSLENGRVKLAASKSAFDNLFFKASLAGDDLKIANFSSDFAGGKLKLSGVVKQFRTQALSGFTLSARDLALDQMMPEAASSGPKLSGRLSLDFQGQAAGKAAPQISQSLVGQGKLELRDGVLVNYNVLRTVVQKISIVPGAEDMLRNNLPNIYKAKMNEPSTILQPVQLPFTVQGGQIYFNQLNLVTDFIIIQGAGQVGLDKSIYMKSTVRMHQQLSQTIAQLVPQSAVLSNAQGEFEVPVTIQGRLPQVSVVPDSDYLVQKLLSSEAVQKTIKGFVEHPEQGVNQIRNLLDKPTAAGESGVKNSVAGLLGSEDGLKNLFQQALGGDSSQTAGSATGSQNQ